MRPLQSPVVGARSLQRLEGLRSLGLAQAPVDLSPHRCGPPGEAVGARAECHGL